MAEIGIGTKLYRRSRIRISDRWQYIVYEIVRETAAYFFLDTGEKIMKSKGASYYNLSEFDTAAQKAKEKTDFENEAFDKLGTWIYYFQRGEVKPEKVAEIYSKIKDLL